MSYEDPDGDIWMFDASFLTSNYKCIYGEGCKGILVDDATHLEQGCCSYGAHFADTADRTRVRKYVKRLKSEQWQYKSTARKLGGPIHKDDDGAWVTRVVDEGCVFLNRPGFEGGAGCALHRAALDEGENYVDWKPEVCWQLPLRLTEATDENGRVTHVLREWQTRDWGEEDVEFHWWCTQSPEAHVGDKPVYEEMRAEIVELIGKKRYKWLVGHLSDRPVEQFLPHPVKKRT